jgi:light-regulated signal transduction histidine kinase (bacteriophytochrome)
VRRLTGYDRVKIYRFADDWSGEVVAEDAAPEMPSYLGLHFPASDIPPQARALYRRNPIRIIPDIDYLPSALVPGKHPDTGAPVDLSFAVLRSVSPVHLEYLRNMGVRSSMSVSVLHEGELWGLIACHHAAPMLLPHGARQACELLAQLFGWQIGVIGDIAAHTHRRDVTALAGRIVDAMVAQPGHGEAGLVQHAPSLLTLMAADGLAFIAGGRVTVYGVAPDEDALRNLVRWLLDAGKPDIFATDRLPLLYEGAADIGGAASGLLAVTLSRAERSFLLWFRREFVRTVLWGGDPSKPAEKEQRTERLHPRRSFAVWSTEMRGRSQPWALYHGAAAREIREALLQSMVTRKEELERLNRQLTRSTEALESFIYAASHDLKEPLWVAELQLAQLREQIEAAAVMPMAGQAQNMRGALRRLRTLIDDLGSYAEAGRGDEALEPVELGALLDEAKSDLAARFADTGARLERSALPAVLGNRRQLRQVLQNLVANALKYRHPGRTPVVRVNVGVEAAVPRDPLASAAPAPSFFRITIADNGIGFAPDYAERIFQPFERLERNDGIGGSGLGLAICRRIVERHGGTISAEAIPGEGARFSFTLPRP